MNVKPIQIGRFRISPVMGALMWEDGAAMSDGEFNMPFESGHEDSAFLRMQEEQNLKGHWPPDDEARRHLETLVRLAENVEKKTGIQWDSHIIVAGGAPGFFGVTGNYGIMLDYNIASNQSPMSKDDIEAVLYHEAAHIKHRDGERLSTIGAWTKALTSLESLQDFARDEPDKFLHLLREQFGSLDTYKTVLAAVIANADQALAAVEHHPAYEGMNDQKMLDLLSRDTGIGETMSGTKPYNEKTGNHLSKLIMVFGHKSAKEISAIRQAAEKAGVPFDSSYFDFPEASVIPAGDGDKKQLEQIHQELLTPLKTRTNKLVQFLTSYSLAAEYRADDLAIIHAAHPEEYPKIMRRMISHIETDQQPMAETMQSSVAEEFLSHPPLELREERAMRLTRRLSSMREMCGEIDAKAAILAVNEEMKTISAGINISGTNRSGGL